MFDIKLLTTLLVELWLIHDIIILTYDNYLWKAVWLFDLIWYLQSLDMPTARHFLNLQYWQRFRFNLITRHLPSLRHLYSICFCMLLLKNPYGWKTRLKLDKSDIIIEKLSEIDEQDRRRKISIIVSSSLFYLKTYNTNVMEHR